MVPPSDLLPDDGLFHYTDIRGLYGILEEEKLWATHVGYLNDSREFTLGMELIDKQLELESLPPAGLRSISVPTPSDMMAALSHATARGLQQNFRTLSEVVRKELGPFVACLSAAGNQLSQWRGYGAGGGYAICFEASALQQHLRKYAPDVEPVYEGVHALPIRKRDLGRVIYYPTEPDRPVEVEALPLIDERITSLIKNFRSRMDDIFVHRHPPPEHLDRELQALLGPDMVDLLSLATRFKHDGFEEEKECRIVTFCPPEFFSPSEIGLIPRVEIDFPPSCVRGIRIGPGQHMATRESSVRAYLHKHKDRYSHVEVSRSDIPFTGI